MATSLPNQKPITILTATTPFSSYPNAHKPLLSRTNDTSKATTASYEPTMYTPQCSLSLTHQNNNTSALSKAKPKSMSTSPLKYRASDHELQLHLIKKENMCNLTKLQKLQNRIAILQKQNLINEKKLHQIQMIQHHQQQIISSKQKLKKQLAECKTRQLQSFQLQQKKIQHERISHKEHLTNLITQRRAKAKKIYQHMKNDKLAIQTKLKESYLHTYNENVKKCNSTKRHRLFTNIKREQDKIDKNKVHQKLVLHDLEKEIQNNNILNKNIRELELLEEECLQKYKQTLSMRKQKEGKSCLNTSMIHMRRGQKYKLDDDKINEEDDNEEDPDEANEVNGYVKFIRGSNNSVYNRKKRKMICLNHTDSNNISKDNVSGTVNHTLNPKQIRIIKGGGTKSDNNNHNEHSDGKPKRKRIKHASFDKNMYNE